MVQSWNHLALKRPECLLHLWSPGNGSQPRVFRDTSTGFGTLSRFGTIGLLSWASGPLFLWPSRLSGKEQQLKHWGKEERELSEQAAKRREKCSSSAPRAVLAAQPPASAHLADVSTNAPGDPAPAGASEPLLPAVPLVPGPHQNPLPGAPLWPSALCL